MDAVDSTGMVVTVSVWAQRINIDPPRSVVVLEPVERTTACVTFDSTVSAIVVIYISLPRGTKARAGFRYIRVRTHPGKYCNLIIIIPGLEYLYWNFVKGPDKSGIQLTSLFLCAVFLPCLYL